MSFQQNLHWTYTHMPLLQRALAMLPGLNGVRLACSLHLDIKMAPLIEGLLKRGAQVFLTTCNPATVRDEVVAYLHERGAAAAAWYTMQPDAYHAAIERALDWQPTHLCEMGAELTVAAQQRSGNFPPIRASLEATGSGISRLAGLDLRYPIFNWDDLPVKEGLHNRHMVGLTTWHAFFERTRLTLHGKQVLVIGFGLVGRGLADAARAYGGSVTIVERDPVRALEAMYAGWNVQPLDEAIERADVIVTATGASGVVRAKHMARLRDGVFLLNAGHRADEIDLGALLAHAHEEVLPFVKAVRLAQRTIYLFADGSMANLTAGQGDSLSTFDVTLAVMVAGIGYIVGAGSNASPGLYILPQSAWEGYIAEQ